MKARSPGVVVVLLLPLALAADWVEVDLGEPPEGTSNPIPRQINDRGQIAGEVSLGQFGFEQRVFLWEAGTWTILPTLGGTFAWVTGLDERGFVVGVSETDEIEECFDFGEDVPFCYYLLRGFVWDGESIEALGPAGFTSEAGGIGRNGSIVGRYDSPNGWIGARWDAAGREQVLQPLVPDGAVLPFAVNARGQVAGSAWNGTRMDAAVWDPRQGVIDLGTLGGPRAFPTAINGSGLVVGYSENDVELDCVENEWGRFCLYQWRPFVWDGAEMSALDGIGGPSADARDVNDHGTIVGNGDTDELLGCHEEGGLTYCSYDFHAVVWQGGLPTDLGVEGETSYATGVNNRDEIVGYSDGRPVIWRPVP